MFSTKLTTLARNFSEYLPEVNVYINLIDNRKNQIIYFVTNYNTIDLFGKAIFSQFHRVKETRN